MEEQGWIGRYRVLRELGRGGMGVVYEVEDPHQPGRRLALKQMLRELCAQADLVRFAREAEMLGRIQHPNVVRVLDCVLDPVVYLVTELVEGEDLKSLVARGALEQRRAVEIVAGLGDAVGALHDAGVIHRDLKPENAIVRPDGTPVLLDFGLARELDAQSLTQTGQVLGTPAFMPPEQANGDKDVDERADVYGLGAILFSALSGQAPFNAESLVKLLYKVMETEPDWRALSAAKTPAPLVHVVQRALARDRDQRYPSAQAFTADLRRWLAGEAVLARPVRRGRGVWIAGLALGLALAGGGVALWARQGAQAVEEPDLSLSPSPSPSAGGVLARMRERAAARAAEEERERIEELLREPRVGEVRDAVVARLHALELEGVEFERPTWARGAYPRWVLDPIPGFGATEKGDHLRRRAVFVGDDRFAFHTGQTGRIAIGSLAGRIESEVSVPSPDGVENRVNAVAVLSPTSLLIAGDSQILWHLELPSGAFTKLERRGVDPVGRNPVVAFARGPGSQWLVGLSRPDRAVPGGAAIVTLDLAQRSFDFQRLEGAPLMVMSVDWVGDFMAASGRGDPDAAPRRDVTPCVLWRREAGAWVTIPLSGFMGNGWSDAAAIGAGRAVFASSSNHIFVGELVREQVDGYLPISPLRPLDDPSQGEVGVAHASQVNALCFGPGGTVLYSGSGGYQTREAWERSPRTLKVWRAGANLTEYGLIRAVPIPVPVRYLEVNAKGDRLLLTRADNLVELWDAGELLAQ